MRPVPPTGRPEQDETGGEVALVRPYAPPGPPLADPAALPPPPLAAAPADGPHPGGAGPARPSAPRARRRRGPRAVHWLPAAAAAVGLLAWALPSAPPTTPDPAARSTDRPTPEASAPASPGESAPTRPAQPSGPGHSGSAPATGPAVGATTTVTSRPLPSGASADPAAFGTPSGPGASATAPASATATPSQPPASTPSPTAGPTLRRGDRGPEVARLQSLLYRQGKTYVTSSGTYDKATERAVRETQQEYGITTDPPGCYGPATRAAIDHG
ncbi:peptidoglycan-binding protein [Kitasatospora sp. NPDC001540]|uniref:peptidoglycan-binding protein n=1 Tax=Kitasatospora sp. NPDC001540 TaxID=3364014 RepID=UPI0036AE52DB